MCVAGSKQQRGGSITFVDLAGSERSGDSTHHSREQIKQTADINTSLSALKVLWTVVEGEHAMIPLSQLVQHQRGRCLC